MRLEGISPARALLLVSLLTAGTLRAQRPDASAQLGTAPGPRFTLVQRSAWLSDGLDPTAASPAESTLVAQDSAAAADSLATGRYGSLPLALTSWLTLARRAPALASRDTLEYRYAAGADSMVLRWAREPQALAAAPAGAEGWLRLRSTTRLTIDARRTIEQQIDPPGVVVHTRLSGSLEEQLLVHPGTGQVDSVHARGTLSGQLTYLHADGRSVTIHGRWVVAQDACRYVRPDSAAAIWIGESGYLDALCPVPGEAPRAFWPLAARAARGDTIALDSLLVLRRRETDPLRQAPAGFLDVSEANRGAFVRRAIAAYRPGDADLLSRLARRVAFFLKRGADDPGLAALLAREFRDLRHERAAGIDRREVLSLLWSAVGRGEPVSPAVAGTLAEAAARTDDPRARDVFLLAAYRAAPERYAQRVERLDPRAWARRWARGETPPWDTIAFPGLSAPWQAHGRYLAGSYREEKLAALRAWFAARQSDPIRAFRERYDAEPDTAGRFVWAEYLLALGDSRPAAWLEGVAEADQPDLTVGRMLRFKQDSVAWFAYLRQDSLVKRAFGILWDYRGVVADTVRDPAMLTGAQVYLLRCDSAATGEREPDFLLASSVTRDAQARCGQRFRLVESDSLQRLADRDGRVWATVVSPLLRIGNRYVMEVLTRFWTRRNQFCLCGGGERYRLQYRDGRWSAVLIDSWVS